MYVKCYPSYNVLNMYYKEECGEEILTTNIEVPICRVMITALFKKVHVDEHISVYFIHYMLSDRPSALGSKLVRPIIKYISMGVAPLQSARALKFSFKKHVYKL